MDEREFRAGEAKRLLREIGPYLDQLRDQSLIDAMRVPRWMGDRKRRTLLERAQVCEDLKSRLLTVIAVGKPK